MNKELLKLAHISNKGIAKKIIFIIIITILFILIYIPFSLYKTHDATFHYLKNASYNVRMIQIMRRDQKQDVLKLNIQDEDHVVEIINDRNSYFFGAYWLEQNQSNDIGIVSNIDTIVPDVISGRSIRNENEIICPKRLGFGIIDDKHIDDLLDMEAYLNKEIVLTIYKRVSDDKVEEYPFKAKIVGLFDPSATLDYGTCYASKELVKKMYEESKPYNYDNSISPIMFLLIDDYRNVPLITKILDDNNIDYVVPTIQSYLMVSIVNATLYLSAAFFIISTIILYIYITNYIKSKKNNIALYRAMGYSYSTIKFIIYYGVLELLLYSYVCSSILAVIAKYVIQYFTRKIVSFSLLDIKIPYFMIGISIFISLLITYIVSVRAVKKNIKREIKDILV